MEQDKRLQELLLQGSEKASHHFTEAVMDRVQRLSATPFYYQPLVSPRIKKAFLVIVSALVAAIVLLCLLLASPELTFPDWTFLQPAMLFIQENFYTMLGYILSFWLLFAVNAFVEKRKSQQHAEAF